MEINSKTVIPITSFWKFVSFFRIARNSRFFKAIKRNWRDLNSRDCN